MFKEMFTDKKLDEGVFDTISKYFNRAKSGVGYWKEIQKIKDTYGNTPSIMKDEIEKVKQKVIKQLVKDGLSQKDAIEQATKAFEKI